MAQVKSEKQEEIVNYLKGLRDEIISAFEAFEPTARFEKTPWKHHSGGGGEIATLRGEVFEKAAVNWSGVEGTKLPFNENEEPFFATGISLITHMKNPFMPTVHMNVRYFETKYQSWFGGGYDLTPMGFEKEADTCHFHHVALKALGEEMYRDFSKNAAEYFYIKHWKKERGVGGIFFDHHNTGDFEKDYAMWKRVGSTFLDAILPIYERWKDHPYTDEDKAKQNRYRAHYVEFNLLYDRGTKFGFMSGGNPHAILCSMPPTATW
ncbi:MAG: oxygen-dependent coproporphyrinogen oxidase [Chlamydiia bacterium]|nr:oxygen-dependent coproporphyrinogen oxidase [Chlamydiia bacterium]